MDKKPFVYMAVRLIKEGKRKLQDIYPLELRKLVEEELNKNKVSE